MGRNIHSEFVDVYLINCPQEFELRLLPFLLEGSGRQTGIYASRRHSPLRARIRNRGQDCMETPRTHADHEAFQIAESPPKFFGDFQPFNLFPLTDMFVQNFTDVFRFDFAVPDPVGIDDHDRADRTGADA